MTAPARRDATRRRRAQTKQLKREVPKIRDVSKVSKGRDVSKVLTGRSVGDVRKNRDAACAGAAAMPARQLSARLAAAC
ncbi:MAG TPA: hypothetical protein VFW38_09855 [Solirubrobacteraceae bacterium]|nr:hypothetical protein [Solirubrobacteraceae bacterium]